MRNLALQPGRDALAAPRRAAHLDLLHAQGRIRRLQLVQVIVQSCSLLRANCNVCVVTLGVYGIDLALQTVFLRFIRRQDRRPS